MSIYIDAFGKMYGNTKSLKELRNKILHLAMQGKLSAQKDDDFGASVLYDKIQEICKNQKVKTKPNDKSENEVLPNNWKVIKIGQLFELINGKAFKPSDWSTEGLPIIRIQNLNNVGAPFNHCDIEVDKKFYVKDGDILIGWSGTPGTSFGAFIWSRGDAVLNQHIFNAKPRVLMNVEFLKLAINSILNEMISKAHGGAGLKHITKGKFQEIEVPLPSIDEQNRIVKAYNNIIHQVDKLEDKLKKKEHLMELLPQAVVDAIGSCQTGEELKTQLEFVIENFEEIFQTPESMQDLRNVILQLAIEGKLVEQDENDEPASVLVERIKAERDQLVKEKKIKKPKKLEPITDDEIPFEIPKSWVWVRVVDVVDLISGRDEPVSSCNENGVGIPYVMGASNINNSSFEAVRWIEEPKVVSSIGDLVITVKGTVGKYFINNDGDINLSRQTMALRPFNPDTLEYLVLWFENYIHELNSKSQGVIPGVSRNDILEALIPLPSLNEQKKIIEKLNSLMIVINEMEEMLKNKHRIVELLGSA